MTIGDFVGLLLVGIGDLLSDANSDLLGDALAGIDVLGDNDLDALIDPVAEELCEFDPVGDGVCEFDPVGEGV